MRMTLWEKKFIPWRQIRKGKGGKGLCLKRISPTSS